MRIAVQAWSPEYGGEVEMGRLEASVEQVKIDCETTSWEPVAPRYSGGLLDAPVAFVDGTRRIDARLFVSNGTSFPAQGLAGSVGAGSVVCTPPNGDARGRAEIDELRIQRVLAVGGGTAVALSAGESLSYRSLPVPGESVEELTYAVHDTMRNLEAQLAQELADQGMLVFVDGPLAVMRPGPQRIVGFIKAHHRRYLEAGEEAVLGRLGCGERTPLFSFGEPRPRYSWYLRLCDLEADDHDWHGLVRCEAPAALELDDVISLADVSSVLLPRFASLPYWDKRAPQNLVPVAGLEKRLRHLLGDRELVYRMIRDGAKRAGEKGSAVG